MEPRTCIPNGGREKYGVPVISLAPTSPAAQSATGVLRARLQRYQPFGHHHSVCGWRLAIYGETKTSMTSRMKTNPVSLSSQFSFLVCRAWGARDERSRVQAGGGPPTWKVTWLITCSLLFSQGGGKVFTGQWV